jgi:Fe-S cluster biogenesis protein NfuA
MTYALYELALHPEIQNRLRAEIMQVLNKHNGQLTYHGIKEMAYLDMVVSGECVGAVCIVIRTFEVKYNRKYANFLAEIFQSLIQNASVSNLDNDKI